MTVELWIPETARGGPAPGRLIYLCSCGKKFKRPEERQQFRRHAIACAKKREGEIKRLSTQGHIGPLDQERFDFIKKREEEKVPVDYEKDGVMI